MESTATGADAPPAPRSSEAVDAAAVEQAIAALDRRVDQARRRVEARLFGQSVLIALIALSVFNPDLADHQEAAFDAALGQSTTLPASTRAFVELLDRRAQGRRLFPLARVNCGLFSVGMVGDSPMTLGVLGQVYVFDD